MTEYFKFMESVANTDPRQFTSGRELCLEIARLAGYHRGTKTLQNGVVKEVTLYTKSFDDVLTAKWIMHYKKLFYKVLYPHQELKDYFVDIINRTFFHMFRFLQVEKLTSDRSVSSQIGWILGQRIGEVLIMKGSETRLHYNLYEKTNDGRITKSNKRMCMSTGLNIMAESFESMCENRQIPEDTLSMGSDAEQENELIMDIRLASNDNPYTQLVLDTLLNAKKKISLPLLPKRLYKVAHIDGPNERAKLRSAIKAVMRVASSRRKLNTSVSVENCL